LVKKRKGMIRVNLDLDPALHSRLKMEAARRRITLKSLFLERLRGSRKMGRIKKRKPMATMLAGEGARPEGGSP